MCVGGSLNSTPNGCWSGPNVWQFVLVAYTGEPSRPPTGGKTTHRCQVPSDWTGPSHLLIDAPPSWQPALAGGAAAISAPAVRAVASPATTSCLIDTVPRSIVDVYRRV